MPLRGTSRLTLTTSGPGGQAEPGPRRAALRPPERDDGGRVDPGRDLDHRRRQAGAARAAPPPPGSCPRRRRARAAQHVRQRGPRAGEPARHGDLGAVEDDAVGDVEARAEQPERQGGVEQDEVDLVVADARAHRGQRGRRGEEEDATRDALDVDAPFCLRRVEAAAPASEDAVSTT